MSEVLRKDEVMAVLHLLQQQLSSKDLAQLRLLCEHLRDDDPTVSVGGAIQLLSPTVTEQKPAVDALDRLARRLDEAASAAGQVLRLERRGAKKLGLQRRVAFAGAAPLPQAHMPALQRHDRHLIPVRGLPAVPTALLLTVNDAETQAVIDVFQGPGTVPLKAPGTRDPYLDLGMHGDYHVLLARCEQGSSTAGGSQAVVARAIEELAQTQALEVVVAVGVAFGTRPDEQRKGEVLVSAKVLPYEPGRINQDGTITPRGGLQPASTAWVRRTREADTRWSRDPALQWPTVRFGTLLSGEKLVDNLDYRSSIAGLAEKPIGGEMEASGLIAAAEAWDEGRVHWLVVKAISDWADGAKHALTPEQKAEEDALQRRAAQNSARVVLAALSGERPPGLLTLHPSPATRPPASSAALEPARLPVHHLCEPDRLDTPYVPPSGARLRWAKSDLFHPAQEGPHDDDAAAADHRSPVDALDYLRQWLDAPDSPPVFALLGEYGMGKTLLCQRLARTLNEAHLAGESVGPASRQALYFDLRDLQNLREGHVPTLDEVLAECISRSYAAPGGQVALTPARVRAAYDTGGALVILDGLDEVLVHMDAPRGQAFTRGLLALAHPGAKGRLLLSCRTHFFRTLREQITHFTDQDRGDKTTDHFMAMTLLPFSEDQVREYIRRSLPKVDVERVMAMLGQVHNLPELAHRPYTLSLIVALLPRIEQRIARGERIHGVTLYREVVQSWLERDATKHHLKPAHKLELAGHLAAQMWSGGQRVMPVEALERWFTGWLEADPQLRARYRHLSPDKLDEDLRNSTFLVRDDHKESPGFRFAHTSLLEFFLAHYLFDSARQDRPEAWAMPAPSHETLNFLGQMLAEADAGPALAALRRWRTAYRAEASELLMAYALQAHARGWPAPPLDGFDLRGAQLMRRQFGGADRELNMAGIRLDGATLRECEFRRVRMPGGSLAGADLRGAMFQRCDLSGVDFSAAQVAGLRLFACRLRKSRFEQVSGEGMQWLRPLEAPPAPEGTVVAPAHASVRGRHLLPVVSGHGFMEMVRACAFSPDGRSMATAGDDGTVRLWNAASGAELRVLTGHLGTVTACPFSPDGGFIASAGWDGSVRLWDVASGVELRVLTGHSGMVHDCLFSPDGRSIASAGNDGTVRLWDAASGTQLQALTGHTGNVTVCSFAPDGRSLASAGSDGTVRLWDVASGAELQALTGHPDVVHDCLFSPDGRSIASAGEDGTVRLWNAATGTELRVFTGPKAGVLACAFSLDGRSIAFAGRGGMVRLWDAASGAELRALSGHAAWVNDIALSPDGRCIATVGFGIVGAGAPTLWDVASGAELRVLSGRIDRVIAVAFAPDGRRVATSGFMHTPQLWDVISGTALGTLAGPTGGCRTMAFSPDGRTIVSVGWDGSVCLRDAACGTEQQTRFKHKDGAYDCAFSPCGGYIATAGHDGTVRLWDAASGVELRALSGHTGQVKACSFSPDGRCIATTGDDSTVRLWDAASGAELLVLTGHAGTVTTCSFSPDGRFIASAGSDGTVRLWDATSGAQLQAFIGHLLGVTACTFAPDGRSIASAGGDGTVRLWEAGSGAQTQTFTGHQGVVLACVFSPDGRSIASAGSDSTLRLWDIASAQCLRSIIVMGTDHAVFDAVAGRIIEATDEAWRWLGWQEKDEAGHLVRRPVDYYGEVPLVPAAGRPANLEP